MLSYWLNQLVDGLGNCWLEVSRVQFALFEILCELFVRVVNPK